MADIHDFLASCRETNNALSSLRTYGGQIEDGEREGDLATLLAGEAVICAIREFSTRIDYVLRDIARRQFSGS